MSAGFVDGIHKRCYFSSQQIEDLDAHMISLRYLVFNRGCWVERIRVILRKQNYPNLVEEFPALVSNPRGRGLFAAFDVNRIEDRTPIRNKCLQNGLILLPSGERSIRFRPPLNVSRDEISEGLDIIRRTLKEIV